MELIKKYFPDLSNEQYQQYEALRKLYEDWNSRINVISRKDMENFYERHVLHSLAIASKYNFLPGTTVMDLGTGGGFPGIPLAIFFPETRFHLVDSINKKLTVANNVISEIKLKNASTEHARAEGIKGRQFDIVVSRAVAPLKDLWKWSNPLLKKKFKNSNSDDPSGLICLKGGDLKEEIATSGLKTDVTKIEKIFNEEYFKEKFILYVTSKA